MNVGQSKEITDGKMLNNMKILYMLITFKIHNTIRNFKKHVLLFSDSLETLLVLLTRRYYAALLLLCVFKYSPFGQWFKNFFKHKFPSGVN